jgi:hypothetical protein
MTERELAASFPARDAPASASDRGEGTLLPLGRAATGRVVGPMLESHQGRHLALLGETGMGKSSLIVAIARRQAPRSGLILLDPLGETARLVRSELDDGLGDRLLWISPSDSPPTLNALEGMASDDPVAEVRCERRRNDLVHALRRVRAGRYADSSYWGPRLEEMLTRAVRAAGSIPGATLTDAHTLLETGGRTRQVVPPAAVEHVRELADRIRDRPEDADGARRLLHEVVRSPTLERMLCARDPSLRARELVLPGRVVLVSGEAPVVGEATARYLLAVYLALVWSELLARPEPAKTFVLLDEAQWYGHESLAEMLRLARRRNVHVVLATQGLASLAEEVREAVWTNVADFVAFRGSPDEARDLARTTHALVPENLLSLPRGEAVVLLGKGEAVEWVRAARVPPRGGQLAEEPTPEPEMEDPPDEDGGPGRVMRYLRGKAHGLAPEAVVTVSTDELRRMVDPSGESVRAVGTVLGRQNGFARVDRSASGTVWHVRVSSLDSPNLPPSSEDAEEGS